eukprot:snap_masked-scaffold_22-processed-gene-3.4-mRNA-1 protein AED:1.00 eAED:1.00 QI:0/0/0/0/1/1/2/0/207
MWNILKFIFKSPDPVSSRNAILDFFDEYVKENNLTYRRNDIKTIIIGKNVFYNYADVLYWCISFCCCRMEEEYCSEDPRKVLVILYNRRRKFYTKAIILPDAIFIYREDLPEEITPDLSCIWRKNCFNCMPGFDSVPLSVLRNEREFEIYEHFKKLSLDPEKMRRFSTAEITYFFLDQFSVHLLFTEEEKNILEDTYKKYIDQLNIV